MKIGFLGNANNYPFLVARAIRKLGHEVIFVVDNTSLLNRPEGRYKEINVPYPAWILDFSPLNLWHYPSNELAKTAEVVRILGDCDAVVLNEFGLSLWGRIGKPAFAFLTGTDLEVLADPKYVDSAIGVVDASIGRLKRMWLWRSRRVQGRLRNHFLRLVGEQRDAISHAVGVRYFPKEMLPNADRLLKELGVNEQRRVFFIPADIERYEYAPYPTNRVLRLFNVARLQWRKPNNDFICELDYKGTDVLIRGLGLFIRENRLPVEIRLVKKGVDLDITQQLIEMEGIASSVTWLEEMDQNKLYEEYKSADIVSEHFGMGSIGMGAVDAMAVGRPVIANGSPDIFRKALGEAAPICHATTPEEVRGQLLRLAVDRNLRASIGKQSRLYVERYCSPELAAKIILEKFGHAK
jgi:glycosyltransferase involved in cell wall biosynthesis